VQDFNILLTGGSGQVGRELAARLGKLGNVTAPQRAELDLSQPRAIREVVERVEPRWIVHSAAYTAVDKAESEPHIAHAINVQATRALAEEAKAIGAALVSFSTDYVFDGSGEHFRTEEEATGPLNVYGVSKLEAERAIAASGATALVFRTSWVYSAHGQNFVRTILRLARERESIAVVDDQHGSPTSARDLAAMVGAVMERIEASGAGSAAELASPFGGVYHAAGRGETTWFGFAQFIVERAREYQPQKHWAEVLPVPSSEYKALALRPVNSRLDCGKLQRVFGWTFPGWRDSVDLVIRELLD
jgi:dTDP-4-dehydrorhamnose reductase